MSTAEDEAKRKDRPEDQPLPVPNDGPAMHDLVCDDLRRYPAALRAIPEVIADMQARKRLGYRRYGSFLQAHNERDAALDLYEELQDAVAYARQVTEENPGNGSARSIYRTLLSTLLTTRRLRDDLS